VDAIREAAVAASGRVDLAVIAVDNAMAAVRDAESHAVDALRRHGDGGLDTAFRGLLAAMEAGRGAWGDTVAIAQRADTLSRLAEQARGAWGRLEAALAGQGRDEAMAIAAAAAEAERLAREIEALTLDLRRRWLLPLPGADTPAAPVVEGKADARPAVQP